MPETTYVPHRKCIACRTVKPKDELIRIVLSEGELKADAAGKLQGRGCYVCKSPECVRTAAEKNCFSKSFRKGFAKDQLAALAEELKSYVN